MRVTTAVGRAILCAGAAVALAACHPRLAPAPAGPPPAVASATQLVVVTTADWDAVPGTLRRFARASPADPWRAEGTAVPIVVGRTGLAWGVRFDAEASAGEPHKHEGDGRAPAGAFPLDTAFGFAPADSMRWVRLPYAPLAAGVDCVDDTASAHYNTVVDRGAVPVVDWTSAERMREVAQYRIGVIVGYNAGARPARGRGSCIFLHIWSGPASHTVGCTAMDAAELRRVVAWLDPRARPVLVQMPVGAYERLRSRWGLPRPDGS